MKRIATLLFVLVAVLMLFAATEVMAANCVSPDCFTSTSGYRVEIVPPFPTTDLAGNTVFNYMITGTKTGVTGVSHIDILIPVCDPNAIAIYSTSPCPNSPCYWYILPGVGESSTGFGIGDLQHRVLKWNISYSGTTSMFFSVTIIGSKVSAEPTSMLLKLGKVAPESGVILGPACYAPPLPASQTEQSYTADTPVGPATIRCQFDRLGNLLSCLDVEYNIPLTLVPVSGKCTCNLFEHLITIDYIESGCTMVGSGSPLYCVSRIINGQAVQICR